MNPVNILHAIPSPRDNIKAVLDYQPDLPFDRFIPKFLPEVDAYHLAREFFLKNKNYTHLAIGTDDIVVKPEHMQHLARVLQESNFPVLSGVMNVYQEDHDILNITPPGKIPSPEWASRIYDWINIKHLGQYTHNGTIPIIEVGFSGFPLMIIRRDVVEQIPFESDALYNPVPYPLGGSLDVQFCYSCHRRKIPIFADTRVNMDHLRTSGQNRVGTERPHVILWKKSIMQRFEIKYTEGIINFGNDFEKSGYLLCSVCMGEAEGQNLKEAMDKLDHAVARERHVRCPADPKTLIWNGRAVIAKPSEKIKIPHLVES